VKVPLGVLTFVKCLKDPKLIGEIVDKDAVEGRVLPIYTHVCIKCWQLLRLRCCSSPHGKDTLQSMVVSANARLLTKTVRVYIYSKQGMFDDDEFRAMCQASITSVDHKGVTCYGPRGRGAESRSLMTSVETRDLSGKADRSRVNSNTKRVGKSRHVDGGMFTTVVILNEKSFDP